MGRVNFDKMFNYLKDIKQKENGKISDEALKLISKCSEGSVRDALSLLDRALLSSSDNEELDLATAQKIFGHFDKSKVIDLINLIIEAEEEKTFEVYRSIFQNNVEPITFLNDFLEILYYIKNIDNIKLYGKNFDLNDQEFNKINEISKKIDKKTIILFWHFTIKILDEIKIVSNQNIAIEMFIFRLMYLKSFVNKNNDVDLNLIDEKVKIQNEKNENNNLKNFQTVNQIKNVVQKEEKNKNEITNKYDQILSFDELINLCSQKKEMSLKYELETNVNLVNFEKNRIDIAFNDKINKNFIKDLSNKLLEWTNERWILTLSKESGKISKKDKLKKKNDEFIDNFKNSKKYKDLRNIFDDIIIKKVEIEQENND